jgi:hypothetical protein
MLALVVERVQLRRLEIDSALDVTDEGVIGPGIPEAGYHVEELAGAAIAGIVLDMLVEAEVHRFVRVARGDEVPPRPTAAQMIQRGKAARHVIGLVVSRRGGRDQPQAFGDDGECRQQCERLERGDGAAALQRLDRHVEQGLVIGHEEGVELAAFQRLGEAL